MHCARPVLRGWTQSTDPPDISSWLWKKNIQTQRVRTARAGTRRSDRRRPGGRVERNYGNESGYMDFVRPISGNFSPRNVKRGTWKSIFRGEPDGGNGARTYARRGRVRFFRRSMNRARIVQRIITDYIHVDPLKRTRWKRTFDIASFGI